MSPGAMRAGQRIQAVLKRHLPLLEDSTAQTLAKIIDGETAAPELLALAKHILALETDPYLQGHPEWEAFLNEAKAAETKAETGIQRKSEHAMRTKTRYERTEKEFYHD